MRRKDNANNFNLFITPWSDQCYNKLPEGDLWENVTMYCLRNLQCSPKYICDHFLPENVTIKYLRGFQSVSRKLILYTVREKVSNNHLIPRQLASARDVAKGNNRVFLIGYLLYPLNCSICSVGRVKQNALYLILNR